MSALTPNVTQVGFPTQTCGRWAPSGHLLTSNAQFRVDSTINPLTTSQRVVNAPPTAYGNANAKANTACYTPRPDQLSGMTAGYNIPLNASGSRSKDRAVYADAPHITHRPPVSY
jgi:hypothetical protein